MWKLTIDNIAGIRDGNAQLHPGLNIVQASNFQGKSSFIDAIRTVIGCAGHYQPYPLTEDAAEGQVTLTTPSATYSIELQRQQTQIATDGTPYLTNTADQVAARLFACLGEANPIRQAVRNEDDLTDLLQAPLDLENIEAKIESLQQEREQIQADLNNAQEAADRVPIVKQTIADIEATLAELREQKAQLEADTDYQQALEPLSDKLSTKQQQLEQIANRRQRISNRIERKEARLEKKQTELDELTIQGEVTGFDNIEEKQAQATNLAQQIDLLEDLYRANQNALAEDLFTQVSEVDHGIAADEIDCWVCGNQTTVAGIETQLEELQEMIESLRTDHKQLEQEIAEYREQQRKVERQQEKREQIEQTISTLKTDLAGLRSDREQAEENYDRLTDEINELTTEIEELEMQHNEDLADIKAETREAERRLDNKREKLADLKSRADSIETYEQELADVESKIDHLRNRRSALQFELKSEFDAAMEEIIDTFAPGFDGAYLDIKTQSDGTVDAFELRIARDGAETSVTALSEGEVELIGMVVAIAGYRTYDVNELIPIMLIDGISQLAAEHLRQLIDYISEKSDIVVASAYPEAGSFEGHTVNPQAWEVVSDEQTPSSRM